MSIFSAIEAVSEESNDANIDVSKDWRYWCRLCAKPDIQNINIFPEDEHTSSKEDNELNLSAAILKYFSVKIEPDAELPTQLCTECFSLTTSLINFNERVTKVQHMYHALKHFHDNTVETLESMRLQYDVFKDDEPHKFLYRSLVDINLYQEEEVEICDDEVESFTLEEDNEDNDIVDLAMKTENTVFIDLSSDTSGCNFENESLGAEDPCGSDIELKNDDEETNKLNGNDLMGEKNYKKRGSMSHEVFQSERTVQKIGDTDTQTLKDAENETYTCIECSRIFKKIWHYRKHMKTKHDFLPLFPCSECPLSFNTPNRLNIHHIKKHMPINARRTIPCPHCDHMFSDKMSLKNHIRFSHIKERPIICEECGVGLRTITELRKHITSHTDYAPHKCEVCKKCFKHEEHLKKHMETHNPDGYTCRECGLQLSSKATLYNHLVVHSDVRRHKCDYCGQAFKLTKGLKQHLLIHTGLRPYICEFCNKTYTNAANLRGHKKNIHPVELAAEEAAGEKAYTKIPKLSTLKSVIQTSEHLKPSSRKKSIKSSNSVDS